MPLPTISTSSYIYIYSVSGIKPSYIYHFHVVSTMLIRTIRGRSSTKPLKSVHDQVRDRVGGLVLGAGVQPEEQNGKRDLVRMTALFQCIFGILSCLILRIFILLIFINRLDFVVVCVPSRNDTADSRTSQKTSRLEGNAL